MDLIRNFFKGDKVIWIVFLFFCLISIIEVFSASSTLAYKSGNHWQPITSHLTYLMLGVGVAWSIHRIPYRMLHLGYLLLPFSWLLLFFVLIISVAVNGAHRWIIIGGIQFQPSEIAKMAVLFFVARILSLHQEKDGANPEAFKWILYPTLLTVGLIFTENLSTAILLFATVFFMMFIGRIPLKQLGKLIGAFLIIGAIGFVAIKTIPPPFWGKIKLERLETWQSRLSTHFNEKEVPASKFDIDTHAQIAHANIAISGSNVIGKGPGNSVQRDFLSQAFSDFIYAIIIEELGLGGGIFVALLYIVLLIRIGKIAKNCDNDYYTFLIMGIGILIGLQAMFNMLVAVGIMPVTGQPLPFISKGGTSTFINCCYIGILLNVSRYVNEKQEAKEKVEAEQQAQIQEAAVALLRQAADNISREQREADASTTDIDIKKS